MSLENLIWPSDTHADPNIIQRLGRIIHWGFAGGAAIWAVYTITDGPQHIGSTLLGAIAISMVGRVFRYLLAGE